MPAILLVSLIPLAAGAANADGIFVTPQPRHVALGTDQLAIGPGFRVALSGYREPRLKHAADRLMKQLALPAPAEQARRPAGWPVVLTVHCERQAHEDSLNRDDESYTLRLASGSARIDSRTPLGALLGLQTFLLLLHRDGQGYYAPVVTIDDAPRFAWRGLMIDSVRHFMPVDVIEGNIDRMAAVKLNVFHWHLTDDQAVRVESKLFPKLQTGDPFYTQAQIREVVAYAHDRGIRVVPEFEGPGHATAWVQAYPELSASGQLDPTNEAVYRAMDAFFGEMSKLFPDRYVHTGGDEVDYSAWAKTPNIQAYMKAHGITEVSRLQNIYTQRIHDILKKRGKIMIGWNEVLTHNQQAWMGGLAADGSVHNPGLPADVTVQSWLGLSSLADALKRGNQAILSRGYYLDHSFEEDFYRNDPESGPTASLTSAERERLLGGEACMWTENVTPETIYSRVWPRAAMMAERLWSSKDVTDEPFLVRRLTTLFDRSADRNITLFREPVTQTEAPFRGAPAAIPGTIQAEDFDRGGEGVGYHALDPFSPGGSYRPDDSPGVEACADAGGGFNIAAVRPGQWLRYTVDVAAAGDYTVAFRVASTETGTFHIEDANGHNLTGPIASPSTGGWQAWTTISAHIRLRAGTQALTFVEDTGAYNVNFLQFTRQGP